MQLIPKWVWLKSKPACTTASPKSSHCPGFFFFNGMHKKRERPGPFYRLNRPNSYQGRQGRGSFIPRLFLWERGNVPGDEAREGEGGGGGHWLKELAGSLSL